MGVIGVLKSENVFSGKHIKCDDARSISAAMTFTTPQEDRYFEDYLPGAVHEFAYVTIGEAEIIEFARRFDPQSFHIDPERRSTRFWWIDRQLLAQRVLDHAASR
jgi:hypothetical protein